MSLGDVSVVIPCFNDGATVGEALASVRPDKPREIIIIDDGSDDPKTRDILTETEGVQVIRQPNTGVAGARRRGAEAATGDFVMFLDADDIVAPGALARMAAALRKDPSLSVVWGDIEQFGRAGYRYHSKGRCLDPWRITFVNELVASTMVRRTSFTGLDWSATGVLYEDWDLWMTFAERGLTGQHVGGVTLRYRVDAPKAYGAAVARHAVAMAQLRSRHPKLLADRSRNRRTSSSGRLLKLAWTAADAIRMPARARRYALFGTLVLCEPSRRRRRSPKSTPAAEV